MTHSCREYQASDKGVDHKAVRQSKTARATKYNLLYEDPVSNINGYWSTNDHQLAVKTARARHKQGENVTVVNTQNGNVVIWLGRDLSVGQ